MKKYNIKNIDGKKYSVYLPESLKWGKYNSLYRSGAVNFWTVIDITNPEYTEIINNIDNIWNGDVINLKDITYNGGSVLISSHIVEDLERVCNSIVFIHEGKIILDSDKKELLNKYEIFNLNKEQWDSLNKEYVFKYKQIDEDNYEFIASSGKYDLKNKRNANLSEIMILIVRGKNV